MSNLSTNTMNTHTPSVGWIEISQPGIGPIIISLSTVQAIAFLPGPNGQDAIRITSTLWSRPLTIQNPRAKFDYMAIKRFLKPKVLEC